MNLQSRASVCAVTSVPTITVPTQLWWTTARSGTSSNCPASKDCLPISGESQEEWEEESSENFSVPPPGYNPMNPPPPGVEQPPNAYAASSQAGGIGEGQFMREEWAFQCPNLRNSRNRPKPFFLLWDPENFVDPRSQA